MSTKFLAKAGKEKQMDILLVLKIYEKGLAWVFLGCYGWFWLMSDRKGITGLLRLPGHVFIADCDACELHTVLDQHIP